MKCNFSIRARRVSTRDSDNVMRANGLRSHKCLAMMIFLYVKVYFISLSNFGNLFLLKLTSNDASHFPSSNAWHEIHFECFPPLVEPFLTLIRYQYVCTLIFFSSRHFIPWFLLFHCLQNYHVFI